MKKQVVRLTVLLFAAYLFQQSKCYESGSNAPAGDMMTRNIRVHVADYAASTAIAHVQVAQSTQSGEPNLYLTNNNGNTPPIQVNNGDSLVLSLQDFLSDTIVLERIGMASILDMYMSPLVQPLFGQTLFGSVFKAKDSTAIQGMKIYNIENPSDTCRSDSRGIFNLKVSGQIQLFHIGLISGAPDSPDTTKVKVTVGADNSTRLDVYFDDTKILKKKRRPR